MAQYKYKLNPLTSQFNLVPSVIIVFKASVANFAALPSVGNEVGDARITEDTDHWYSWDGSAWNDQGVFLASNWANINGRPSSSVADIDSMVSNGIISVAAGNEKKITSMTYNVSTGMITINYEA